MRRREFVMMFGSAAALCALSSYAQQPPVPVVGFLSTRSPAEAADHTAAFLRGLKEAGYVAGQNVAIEYRWASGDYERLPALATELTRLHVGVIAAGGDPSALAAKAATSSIPIAFVIGDDPMRVGLVTGLQRPGGNATGVSLITSALGSKRLELLCEMVPNAGFVALLVNPTNPNAKAHTQEVSTAAQALGRRLLVLRASTETEVETNFAALTQADVRGLVVENDPFFDTRRDLLVALAGRHAVPAIYHIREFPAAGGLVSYGPDLADAYRELGAQTGRILKGANPSDLPVVRPTKFELVINLKTARTLGITIPANVVARSDEVIE